MICGKHAVRVLISLCCLCITDTRLPTGPSYSYSNQVNKQTKYSSYPLPSDQHILTSLSNEIKNSGRKDNQLQTERDELTALQALVNRYHLMEEMKNPYTNKKDIPSLLDQLQKTSLILHGVQDDLKKIHRDNFAENYEVEEDEQNLRELERKILNPPLIDKNIIGSLPKNQLSNPSLGGAPANGKGKFGPYGGSLDGQNSIFNPMKTGSANQKYDSVGSIEEPVNEKILKEVLSQNSHDVANRGHGPPMESSVESFGRNPKFSLALGIDHQKVSGLGSDTLFSASHHTQIIDVSSNTITLEFTDVFKEPVLGHQFCAVLLESNASMTTEPNVFAETEYVAYDPDNWIPHVPVILAEFRESKLPFKFTVGDGKLYGGFKNGPLLQGSFYHFFIREIHYRDGNNEVEHFKVTPFLRADVSVNPTVFKTLGDGEEEALLLGKTEVNDPARQPIKETSVTGTVLFFLLILFLSVIAGALCYAVYKAQKSSKENTDPTSGRGDKSQKQPYKYGRPKPLHHSKGQLLKAMSFLRKRKDDIETLENGNAPPPHTLTNEELFEIEKLQGAYEGLEGHMIEVYTRMLLDLNNTLLTDTEYEERYWMTRKDFNEMIKSGVAEEDGLKGIVKQASINAIKEEDEPESSRKSASDPKVKASPGPVSVPASQTSVPTSTQPETSQDQEKVGRISRMSSKRSDLGKSVKRTRKVKKGVSEQTSQISKKHERSGRHNMGPSRAIASVSYHNERGRRYSKSRSRSGSRNRSTSPSKVSLPARSQSPSTFGANSLFPNVYSPTLLPSFPQSSMLGYSSLPKSERFVRPSINPPCSVQKPPRQISLTVSDPLPPATSSDMSDSVHLNTEMSLDIEGSDSTVNRLDTLSYTTMSNSNISNSRKSKISLTRIKMGAKKGLKKLSRSDSSKVLSIIK